METFTVLSEPRESAKQPGWFYAFYSDKTKAGKDKTFIVTQGLAERIEKGSLIKADALRFRSDLHATELTEEPLDDPEDPFRWEVPPRAPDGRSPLDRFCDQLLDAHMRLAQRYGVDYPIDHDIIERYVVASFIQVARDGGLQ